MMERIRRTQLLGVIAPLLAVTLIAGCGGGTGQTGGDSTDVTNSAAETAETNTETTAGGETSGSADRCPLTAEQVSAALGATVETDGTACTFFPADGASPSAIFVRLPAGSCTEELIAAMGVEFEPYDGLGVDAYGNFDSGARARILVCADAPFEISTDTPGDEEASLAAVEELVRLVLEGE